MWPRRADSRWRTCASSPPARSTSLPTPSSAGLIDATGDLEDAIDWVAAAAQVPRRVRLVRPRRGLRELLFARASMALVEAALFDLEASLPAPGGYALYTGGRP